jgi:hypothetical protein
VKERSFGLIWRECPRLFLELLKTFERNLRAVCAHTDIRIGHLPHTSRLPNAKRGWRKRKERRNWEKSMKPISQDRRFVSWTPKYGSTWQFSVKLYAADIKPAVTLPGLINQRSTICEGVRFVDISLFSKIPRSLNDPLIPVVLYVPHKRKSCNFT